MKTETTETEKTGQEPSQEELDNLIRNHVYASMGVGLVPIPLADFLALTGIQINLLRKLAKTYDVPFSKDTVKNILLKLSLLLDRLPASSPCQLLPEPPLMQ